MDTTREMSIDSFIAHYAPKSFDVNSVNAENIESIIRDQLTPDTQIMLDKARRFCNGRDFQFQVSVYGYDTHEIDSQNKAADEIDRMEKSMLALQEAMKKVDALKAYYQAAAEVLAATKKIPAYILSRNTRYGDAHITYTIAKGYFDQTIDRLVITSWKEGEFTGK